MNPTTKRCFALAATLWAGAASAEIYRCEQDGKLIFSDKPCVAGDTPISVDEPNTMEHDPGDAALARQHDRKAAAARRARSAALAESDKAYAERKKTEAAVREGRIRGEITVGMTQAQVSSLLGEPASTRSTQTKAGRSETWTYRNGAQSQTIRFVDGKVTGVSNKRSASHGRRKK